MSSFWQRAMGVPPQPQQPVQQPYWNTPQSAPAAPQQQPQAPQGYQPPHGLAVAPPAASQDQVAPVILQQGYLKRPPGWIKSQPGDRCPNCDGTSFVFSGDGEGTSGMKRRTQAGEVDYGRCFECGYTLNGGRSLSAGQIGNVGMKGIGGGNTSPTRQGQQGAKNFYKIEGRI